MKKACKPNPRDTEKLAQKIKKEYAYMNTMPRHGWLWEIIRRSKEYREQCKILGSNGDCSDGHVDARIYGVYTPGANGSTQIPDPQWRYVDFQRNGFSPPYVTEASPIKMALCPTDEGYIDARQSPHPDIREAIWELFSVMTQTTSNDTVYLGVSVNAKLEEALDEIRTLLKRLLRKNRTKLRAMDKWRYYLIAYDLKTGDPSMTYSEMAKILQEAYPDQLPPEFDRRCAENYCKKAIALVRGGYKKYLYLRPEVK